TRWAPPWRRSAAAPASFRSTHCREYERSRNDMGRLIPLLTVVFAAVGYAALERPPLVDAAKNGDKNAVRALLQKKADVNAAGGAGKPPLHGAIYRDEGKTADLLIRAGAKVNAATDLGVTPLWTASLNGSESMVRRLLEAGANPNA